MHILTLSHFLAKAVYTPEFWNKNFHNKITTSLFEVSKQKDIFFNVTLIINTFIRINQKNIMQTI